MAKPTISRDGPVATLTLTRPEKRNALDMEMLGMMREFFEAEPSPEDRVIVVRSEGPVFCAGIDLAGAATPWAAER